MLRKAASDALEWSSEELGRLVASGTLVQIDDGNGDWTCNGFVPVTYLIKPPWLRTRVG